MLPHNPVSSLWFCSSSVYFKVLLCHWVHGGWGVGEGLFMFYEWWGWRPHLPTEIFLFDGLLWLADRVRIVPWVHPLDLILCMEYFEKPHPVHSLKEENLHEAWWMAAVDMQLVSHGFLSFYSLSLSLSRSLCLSLLCFLTISAALLKSI